MKNRFEIWKRWFRAQEEKIVMVLIALIGLMMLLCGIFWYQILTWLWCVVLKRMEGC